MESKHVSLIGRYVISLGIIALLFAKIDLRAVLDAMLQLNWMYVIPIALSYLLVRICIAFQRLLSFRSVGLDFPFPFLLRAFWSSELIGFVLPGSGLVTNAVFWSKLTDRKYSRTKVGVIILFLQLCNGVSFLILTYVGIALDTAFTQDVLFTSILIFSAIMLVAILPFFLEQSLAPLRLVANRIIHRSWFPSILRKIHDRLLEVLELFHELALWSRIKIMSCSLLVHTCACILFYLIAIALGFNLSFMTILWIRSLIGIIQVIPITVAGLGFRESALVYLLASYGVSSSAAVGLSFTFFAVVLIGSFVGWLLDKLLPQKGIVEEMHRVPVQVE